MAYYQIFLWSFPFCAAYVMFGNNWNPHQKSQRHNSRPEICYQRTKMNAIKRAPWYEPVAVAERKREVYSVITLFMSNTGEGYWPATVLMKSLHWKISLPNNLDQLNKQTDDHKQALYISDLSLICSSTQSCTAFYSVVFCLNDNFFSIHTFWKTKRVCTIWSWTAWIGYITQITNGTLAMFSRWLHV